MQYEEVKELIAIFEKTDLNDMEVQLDNARIRLNRGAVSPWMVPAQPVMAAQPAAMPQAVAAVPKPATASAPAAGDILPTPAAAVSVPGEATAEAEGTETIKAPIVGTFYQSSAPGEEPFVKAGDTVSKGDVVCIIEAMKFMNEVNSEVSGTVMEILVKDGDFVEYGQALFRVNTLH